MGNMQELVVRSSGLSPSARVLVCRILEVALEVVKMGTLGNWNRDSNTPNYYEDRAHALNRTRLLFRSAPRWEQSKQRTTDALDCRLL